MKLNDLTYKIIGCAFEVHSILGSGFQELIYQRALAIELDTQNIEYARELPMDIQYKGCVIGLRRVDFFIENKVMVEIKAVSEVLPVHKAQAINYCEAYEITDGLLINFGSKKMQYHRVYNKNFISPEVTKKS